MEMEDHAEKIWEKLEVQNITGSFQVSHHTLQLTIAYYTDMQIKQGLMTGKK